MPILPDRKKMITTIMDGIGPNVEAKEVDMNQPVNDYDVGLDAAVEDIFTAIETKDKTLMKDALKDFFLLLDQNEPHEEYGEILE